MKTRNAIQPLAYILVLSLVLTFTFQRAARASDTAKILAAIAAGVILYEILDDDDDGRRYRHRGHYRQAPYQRSYGHYNYRGYHQKPYRQTCRHPGRYRDPGRYYERGGPGVRVDIRKGPRGRTSLGFGYRDGRWR